MSQLSVMFRIQKMLNHHVNAGLATDGIYGPKTKAAIQKFQSLVGLPTTGLADMATQGFLFMDNPVNYLKTPLGLPDVVEFHLKNGQYYGEIFSKKQIVLHHTVSGPNPINVIRDWDNTQVAVATAFVIGGRYTAASMAKYRIGKADLYDGVIYEAFPYYFWAHALGMTNRFNTIRNREAVQIELCSYGGLTKVNGQFKSIYGNVIEPESVDSLNSPFRDFSHFHAYTEQQMVALSNLLNNLANILNIELPKRGSINREWFENVREDAIGGKPGLYVHTHYRRDKSDCHPSPLLIEALNNL